MNHPVLFFLIILLSEFSFAVTAEDFPCLFEPNEFGRCWTQVKDPRDGQIYLAIKRCGASNMDFPGDTCTVYYVENSRFKAPEAKCNKDKDFYYGCLYPSDKAEKIACPNFGINLTNSVPVFLSADFVTSEEYAKIREDVLVKRKKREVHQMFFYRDGDQFALTAGPYVWVKINGRWGESTIQKKEVYVACEYWMSGE